MTNPTDNNENTPTPAPAPTAPPRSGLSRGAWIGIAAGTIVVAGALGIGGFALGQGLDRDDDVVVLERTGTTTQDDTAAQSGNSSASGSTDASGSSTAGSSTGTSGGTSAGTTTQDWSNSIAANDDIELHGDTLNSAVAAAMTAAGGEGMVTAAEVSDDPTHRYEVEVTRNDGMEMEVYLDADFQVVATQQWHH